MPVFKKFLDQQGFLLIGAGVFIVLILIILAVGYVFKNNEKANATIKSVRRKFMWSSVFRSIIQGYLIAILMTFNQLNELNISSEQIMTTVVLIIKTILLVCFPVFVISYLLLRRGRIRNKRFIEKFGTLFSSVRTNWKVN